MSNEKLISLFQSFLFRNYGCSLDDVEPTDVKGYWRKKQACDPKTCRSQIHNCMFNEGPINHTIYYTDLVRNNGRFTSPFQTWNLMRERA